MIVRADVCVFHLQARVKASREAVLAPIALPAPKYCPTRIETATCTPMGTCKTWRCKK